MQKICDLLDLIKLSDALQTFTCASAIGNLWSVCLGANILSPLTFVDFNGKSFCSTFGSIRSSSS